MKKVKKKTGRSSKQVLEYEKPWLLQIAWSNTIRTIVQSKQPQTEIMLMKIVRTINQSINQSIFGTYLI